MKQITRKIEQVGEVKQITEVESVFDSMEDYFKYVGFHKFIESDDDSFDMTETVKDEDKIH